MENINEDIIQGAHEKMAELASTPPDGTIGSVIKMHEAMKHIYREVFRAGYRAGYAQSETDRIINNN